MKRAIRSSMHTLAALALAGAAAAGAQAQPASGEPYRIGIILPMTGPTADYGADFNRGAVLAEEDPPAALILRSPFASMTEVGRFHYPMLPVSLLLRDRYASVERIGTVHCPLLVIAGDRDRIIPLAHSRALFDAAAGPKRLVVIPGADHNDESLFAGRRMMDAIREFLEGNSGSGGPPGTLRPPRAAETTDR